MKTKLQAKARELPTDYLDARIDIESSLSKAFKINASKPVVILGSSYSARNEIEKVAELVRMVPKKYITQFEPQVEGFHGSKVLQESVIGNEFYWESMLRFLDQKS